MSEPEDGIQEADLTDAVARTGGIQPWRRAFHATNGTLVVLALSVFGLPVSTALLVLGAILVLTVALDVVRLLDPKANVLFFRTFSSLASPREKHRIASSTWYALSALLVLWLFPLTYALAGILVLAWADPAANIVGQQWGRSSFMAGTLKGTTAFMIVAFGALLIFVPWPAALLAAVATGIVEALPIDLDDNLIVPPVVAAVLFLIGA